MFVLPIGIITLFGFLLRGSESCNVRDCDLDNEDLQASLRNGNMVHFCRGIERYLSCLKKSLSHCGPNSQSIMSSIMMTYGTYLPGCNIDPVQFFVQHTRQRYDDEDEDEDEGEDDEDEGQGRRFGNRRKEFDEEEEDDFEGRYSRPGNQRFAYERDDMYDDIDERRYGSKNLKVGNYHGDQRFPYERDDMYDDIDERRYGSKNLKVGSYHGNGQNHKQNQGYNDNFKAFGLQHDHNLYNNYGLSTHKTNPRIRPKINFGDDVLNIEQTAESDDLHDDLNDDIYDDKIILKSKVRINKNEKPEKEELYDDLHDDKIIGPQDKLAANAQTKALVKNKRKQTVKTKTPNQMKSVLTSIPKAIQSRQSVVQSQASAHLSTQGNNSQKTSPSAVVTFISVFVLLCLNML